MSDISAISAALQNSQLNVQNAIEMQVIKQAAQADQAVADMLEKNSKAVSQATQRGVSIFV